MMENLCETDLTAEFAKLAPWIFQFEISGAKFGGMVSARSDVRLEQFFRFAPEAATILELGSLEGAQSFLLAQQPTVKRIVAVEGREANLRKARFVQELLGIRKVEFALENLEEADLSRYGKFDAVFCCGLLYHLPEPWKLIRQLPAIAPILFLWTAYAGDEEATDLTEGRRGKIQVEGGAEEPLSGLSPTSTWLTRDCLVALLKEAGYNQVEIIDDDANHVNGRVVSIGARCA